MRIRLRLYIAGEIALREKVAPSAHHERKIPHEYGRRSAQCILPYGKIGRGCKREKTPLDVYIIAGPNGAGKTTFAREFLPNYADCRNFINADLIAQGMSPFSPAAAAFRAGRLMLAEIERYASRGESFGFETTLSGRSYANLLRRLKKRGYKLHFFYLWVPTISLTLKRIRARVRAGGHDVPEALVRRRFHRSIRNFLLRYRSFGESWILFDNSGEKPEAIAFQKQGKSRIMSPELYDSLISRYGKP